MNASPSSDSPRPPFSGVHLWVPESRVIIVSQQLSLLRGGACSQITPDSHAGEAPSWGPGTGFLCPKGWCSFPVHALVCGSQVKRMEAAQDLCTVLHRVAVSQWLAPGEAHIPAWDSTFVILFPPVRGPNPEQARHLPGSQAILQLEGAESQKTKRARFCVRCF